MTALYNVLTLTVSFILTIVKIIIVNVWQTSILMTTDQQEKKLRDKLIAVNYYGIEK